MNVQFSALCAELADALAEWRLGGGPPEDTADADLVARARALLAEPVAEGPSKKELYDLFCEYEREPVESMRAALARWGRPAAAPVPVSERLPGPEDCTAQGWCWVFYRGFATWTLESPLGQDGKHTGYTHWLPANALPTPEATND